MINKLDLSTPEKAIISLEESYSSQNINAVFMCKDFEVEAEYLLKNQFPELLKNKDALKETAEMLKLSLVKYLQDSGFPSFENVHERNFSTEKLPNGLIKVSETCIYKDGSRAVNEHHAIWKNDGWRVLNLEF